MVISRRLRPLLGTFVSVECAAADAAAGEAAIAAAFTAIAQVQTLMHPTRGDADLAAINAAAALEAVAVHAWTSQVLQLAKQVADLTAGRFDPCLPAAAGTIDDVQLVVAGQVVCRRRVAIDLGGIAKGYAVDCAVASLQAHGCAHGIVNAGGDLRAFGDEGMQVWIRTSAGTRPIQLCNRACAVSDPGAPGKPIEHRGYYCRTDTTTNSDLHRAAPAVVLAPTAAIADALTKCVLIARAQGDERALADWLEHFDATCATWPPSV